MLRRLFVAFACSAPLGIQAQTFIWDIPKPPTVASGVAYTVGVSASGPVGGTHTLLKNGNYFASGSYYLSRTTTDYGAQTVTYTSTVYDPVYLTGGSDSRSITITAPSTAPTVSISAPGTASVGVPFSISIDAADADGDLSAMGIRMAGGGLVGGPWTISGRNAGNSTSVTLSTTGSFQFRGEVWDAANNGVATSWQTVLVSPRTYALRVDDGSGGGSGYLEGQWINISANPAPAGYYFEKWGLGSATGTIENYFNSSTRFQMGAGNGWAFAVYTPYPKYTLTIVTANGSSTQGELLEGTGVSIHALPPAGYEFVQWVVSGAGTITNPSSPDTGFSVGAGNATVTAIYLSAALSVNPLTGMAPGFTTVAWVSSNATSVTVTGPGISTANSTALNGSQAVGGLPAGSHTYAITAQRGGVSVIKTATFTVAPNSPPTIEWIQAPISAGVNIPFTVQARAKDVNGNLVNIQLTREDTIVSNVSGTGTQLLSDPVSQEQATPGVVTFVASATDSAGLKASDTWIVNIVSRDSLDWGTITPGIGPGIPTATAGVGALAGNFSVDNKGSANYSVPLRLPPGRAGLEPSLALAYNSGSGNGPLGLGWSVSTGFPQAITRGRSILARDGVVRGVQFTSADKYYLDGKRLLWVSGPEGLSGSTYRTEVDSFVTVSAIGNGTGANIDTFVVTDKQGRQFTFGKYGTVTDGYQMGAAPGETLAYAYALKHVQDTVGNAVDFTYTDVTNTANSRFGEYVLSEVRYTAQPNQPDTALGKVTFLYNLGGERPDRTVSYISGRAFAHSRRLDAINVEFNGTRFAYYTLGYETAGESGRTRLKTLTPYLRHPTSGAFESFPAMSFQWSGFSDDAAKPYSTAYSTETSTYKPSALPAGDTPGVVDAGYRTCGFGDFDGDGKEDYVDARSGLVVYRSTGNQFVQETWLATPVLSTISSAGGTARTSGILIADLNGDGRKDIMVCANPGAGISLKPYYSTGTSFQPGPAIDLSPAVGNYWFDTLPNQPQGMVQNYSYLRQLVGGGVFARFVPGDFNGDGVEELLIHGYDGYRRILGGPTMNPTTVGNHPDVVRFEEFTGWLQFNLYQTLDWPMELGAIPCDLNGDGVTDYVWNQKHPFISGPTGVVGHNITKTWHASLTVPGAASRPEAPGSFLGIGSSSSQSTPPATLDTVSGYTQILLTGDFNGDGITDFLYRFKTEGWVLSLGQGTMTGNNPSLVNFNAPLASTFTAPDGETLYTVSRIMTKARWDGLFENPSNPYGGSDLSALSRVQSDSSANTMVMDINHDGLDDLVWFVEYKKLSSSTAQDATASVANKGWWVAYSNGAGFSSPRKLGGAFWTSIVGHAQGYNGSAMTAVSISRPDLNGDGLPDWVAFTSPLGTDSALSVYAYSTGEFGDLVTQVTDGLRRTTDIAYKASKDDTLYTRGADVAYPIREFPSAAPVVAHVWQDTGGSTAAERAQFSYQYSGRRLDLSGRGDLGFHSFVTLDRQTNIFKYQFLAQSFPATGLAVREQTYRYWMKPDSAGHDRDYFRLLSSHDNTVVFDKVQSNATTFYGTLYPFISRAEEWRWEDGTASHFDFTAAPDFSHPEDLFPMSGPGLSQALKESAHIHIKAESLFDAQTSVQDMVNAGDTNASGANVVSALTGLGNGSALSSLPGKITFGNLTQLSTDYGDGYTETVVTTYKNPDGPLTGLVDTVTTTVTSPGYTPQTAPSKSYTYLLHHPLVTEEKVNAADNWLDLTTTYDRNDPLKRIKATTIKGANLFSYHAAEQTVTTSSITGYNDKFDLPTVTADAYGHTTTTDYDAALGQPTTVTDVNNAQITTRYDALGRVVQVRDVLKGLQSDTTFAWNSSQSVIPPADASFPSDAPARLTQTSAYSVTTITTAKPTVTTYYDRLGRIIRTAREGFGANLIYADSVYNVLGQLVATSLPYPAVSPIPPDSATRYWTITTYDPLGRVSTVTAPNGTVTTTTYAGRATTVSVDAPNIDETNPDAQANTTLVDAKGRTVKVWNADNSPGTLNPKTGGSTTPSLIFTLDGFGRMRETTLKGQAAHILADYDELGRQTSLTDPDKGAWNYVNSPLGFVLRQTDARLSVTDTSYDVLGRPLTRTTQEPSSGPKETASWFYYDTKSDDATHRVAFSIQGWIGAPQREESVTANAPAYAAANSATTTAHYYNPKGLPSMDVTTVDDKWFYTCTDYDSLSRPSAVRHYWRPSGLEAPSTAPFVWQDFGYTYTYDHGTAPGTRSYLVRIQDATPTARTWWEANASGGYDYLDRPVLVQKGSGYWSQRTYRPTDGVLTGITTGTKTGGTVAGEIQSLTFRYDGLGNLRQRTGRGGTEDLGYDSLNRLTSSKQGAITYEDNGNIKKKPDVTGTLPGANFTYDPVHPHAVSAAWGYGMTYDANGNLLTRTKPGEQWSLKWAGFDKPRWMAKTTTAPITPAPTTAGSEFLYNANRSRTVQLEFDAMSGGAPSHYIRKRIYALGSTLEVNYDYNDAASGGTSPWQMKKVRVYVPGPDGVIGAREFDPGKPIAEQETALVYHYDHLGSIESITKFGSTDGTFAADAGGKPGRFSEDAWGQRRNPFTWSGAPVATGTNKSDDGGPDSLTPRGFTAHEMLDDLGLVHMNGRIYDPLLGRFLSADVLVDGPMDLQGYNRYSYVKNRPLTLTDPSGFATFENRFDALRFSILTNSGPVRTVRISTTAASSQTSSSATRSQAPGSQATFADGIFGVQNRLLAGINPPRASNNAEFRPGHSIAYEVAAGVANAVRSFLDNITYDGPESNRYGTYLDKSLIYGADRAYHHSAAQTSARLTSALGSIVPMALGGESSVVAESRIAVLQARFEVLAEEHLLPTYRALDPTLEAGYTGSFRTGTVGNRTKITFGQPIDLRRFDIDYWIKSDLLFEKFGPNLRADVPFRKILSETPGFEGLKPNKQGFSILFKPTSE